MLQVLFENQILARIISAHDCCDHDYNSDC